jgi:DNA-binding transcriptional regulator YiaG
MKEADSILRISPTLADSLRREIQFSQPDLARALKQSLTADSVLTEQTLVAHKL